VASWSESLHHVDDGLRAYVVDMMRDRGMEIVEGVEPLAIAGNGKVSAVRYQDTSGLEQVIASDFVFIAPRR